MTYNSTTRTATLAPTLALAYSTTYTATVVGGSSGVKDTAARPMGGNYSWSFTTAASAVGHVSLHNLGARLRLQPRQTPRTRVPSTLGVKFTSSQTGFITGIRYYKGTSNVGTHVGSLWSSTGTLLATATFVGETASGWQQVLFNNPVAITSGTTYVASYFAPSGHYSNNSGYFASSGITNGPLTAPSNLVTPNGVYTMDQRAPFRRPTFNATNYWVDVVFTTTPTAPTPIVTSVTPAKRSYVGFDWRQCYRHVQRGDECRDHYDQYLYA